MSHRSITHVGGVLLALLLVSLAATPSAAIQITAGQAGLFISRGEPFSPANLTGFGGFSLNATAMLGINQAAVACIPYTFFGDGRDNRCAPGDRVGVAATWDTQLWEFGFPNPQTATLHGTTYQITDCGVSCPGGLVVAGRFATADRRETHGPGL